MARPPRSSARNTPGATERGATLSLFEPGDWPEARASQEAPAAAPAPASAPPAAENTMGALLEQARQQPAAPGSIARQVLASRAMSHAGADPMAQRGDPPRQRAPLQHRAIGENEARAAVGLTPAAPLAPAPAAQDSAWLARPEQAFEAWLRSPSANRGRGFSAESLKVYLSMWGKFARFCIGQGWSVALANEGAILQFLEALEQERQRAVHAGPAPGARPQAARARETSIGRQGRRYLSLIARVQTHLVQLGVREDNPAAHLLERWEPEPERPQPSALAPVTDRILRVRLSQRASDDWRELRDRAIVALIAGTGLTSRQVRKLRDDPACLNLQDDPAWVRPVRARTGLDTPGRVPLSRDAAAELETWLQWRRAAIPGDVLFPVDKDGAEMSATSLYRAVAAALTLLQEYAQQPAAAHLGPRTLRHTFATRQLRAGRPLDVLRDWLGHKKLSSTEVYRKLVPDPLGYEPH